MAELKAHGSKEESQAIYRHPEHNLQDTTTAKERPAATRDDPATKDDDVSIQ
jgi:hypothetical protein